MDAEYRSAPEVISLIKRKKLQQGVGDRPDDPRHARRQWHRHDFRAMRQIINLETVNTSEGTVDIHALILGRAQTGPQAFFWGRRVT